MVRAILEGRKSQTRRTVKPQPPARNDMVNAAYCGHPNLWLPNGSIGADTPSEWKCPYGQPGDRLWVRETWRYADWTEDGYPWIEYQADSAKSLRDSQLPPEWSERVIDIWAMLSEEENFAIDGRAADRKWRPSIHMPRWASRITLEVTGVRVERLQGISNEEAQAEGCFFTDYGRRCGHSGNGWTEVGTCPSPDAHHPQNNGWMWDKTSGPDECLSAARWAFANLWESINGAGSWDANPWVWVVAFKRVEVAGG
jgi:hypothetical protein